MPSTRFYTSPLFWVLGLKVGDTMGLLRGSLSLVPCTGMALSVSSFVLRFLDFACLSSVLGCLLSCLVDPKVACWLQCRTLDLRLRVDSKVARWLQGCALNPRLHVDSKVASFTAMTSASSPFFSPSVMDSKSITSGG